MQRILIALSIIGTWQTTAQTDVRVQIFENPAAKQPFSASGAPSTEYAQACFAWTELPRKYLRGGLIGDRSNPFLLRASAPIEFAAGEYQFLLRTKHAARLSIDGKVVIEQPTPLRKNADGHETTPELPQPIRPGHRPAPSLHQDLTALVTLSAGRHAVLVESSVGGKGIRAELGELLLAVAGVKDATFRIVAAAPEDEFFMTESAWHDWQSTDRRRVHELNNVIRRTAAAEDDAYWQHRHQLAARHFDGHPPITVPQTNSPHVNNAIDQFILHRLKEASLTPAERCDDLSFLRRVSLDVIGVIPTLAEIEAFERDDAADRRNRLVDRLLDDPRGADHWVSYWQDVLAENPNILKASLNNTGPFRWWIYESFLDNKPFDRFATELILMRGSRYNGGPAGFEMATQNDVPEANKALVLSRAFLAANMNCARCHDSPINDFSQKQLFSLAAMLGREALALPATSTVAIEDGARQPAVDVSLSPGDQILPRWALESIADDELPAGVLRDASDPREWLAAIVTSPRNERFAKVMVNRLWHRFLGRGLVEPIDDWHDAVPAHPQLLDYLARELVVHGYDVKHVARLILRSQTYQRAVRPDATSGETLYASATRRRMTAEQVFDSLFLVAGKEIHAEMLTMDPEGRRPTSTFLNLGTPRRAWQFSSLSNERDRPALSLPIAQSVNDLLKAYGWRESRQDPRTERDQTITPLQPLVLANGIVGRRLVGLSDDHAVTHLTLYDLSLDTLTRTVFRSFLTREPTEGELQTIGNLLADGFADRIVLDAVPVRDAFAWQRHPVSWANHLHSKSTEIMIQLEQRARQGDPPTPRLQQDWRERMEDVLWALANNPEFLFLP